MFASDDDWILRLSDPCLGQALPDVNPISLKAHCLLVRNRGQSIVQGDGAVRLDGAVTMMRGMDYHHGNFMRLIDRLKQQPRLTREEEEPAYYDLDNEFVAYVNRAGQFLFFVESEFVRQAIGDIRALVPTLARLELFRNKHAAHRSIDAPRGESRSVQLRQAVALTPRFGRMFHPRPGGCFANFPLDGPWRNGYLGYQIEEGSGELAIFAPERDHSQTMAEAYCVLEKLLAGVEVRPASPA